MRCRRGAAGGPPPRLQRERESAITIPAYHSCGRHLLLQAHQFRHYSCRARDFALRRSSSQAPPLLPIASLCGRPTNWTSRALSDSPPTLAVRVGFISPQERHGFGLSPGSMVQETASLLKSRDNSSKMPSLPRAGLAARSAPCPRPGPFLKRGTGRPRPPKRPPRAAAARES